MASKKHAFGRSYRDDPIEEPRRAYRFVGGSRHNQILTIPDFCEQSGIIQFPVFPKIPAQANWRELELADFYQPKFKLETYKRENFRTEFNTFFQEFHVVLTK